ncbi:DUF3164 family protein [Caulobacter sp. 1776]|uniref:DUF3164 family protein n=1 Tax=Caulobacter sp. 1776 TaxID=3156420 RepID=UPI0033960ACA
MSEGEGSVRPGAEVGPGGHVYMKDHRGALIRIETIKEQDLLRDQLVRDLHEKAEALSKAIADFKAMAFGDVGAFNELLASKYGAAAGGVKGNLTLNSFDGLFRVLVQVQDRVVYGPELQQAKALLDEYLTEKVADSDPILQAMVMDAFAVDKAGQINRGALLRLRKYNVEDPRWVRAMQAIVDAEQPDGTAEYIRFHKRSEPKGRWEQVPLDLATA